MLFQPLPWSKAPLPHEGFGQRADTAIPHIKRHRFQRFAFQLRILANVTDDSGPS